MQGLFYYNGARYLLGYGCTRRYWKTLYDWYLTRRLNRNVALVGALTLGENTLYSGFSQSSYFTPTGAVSAPADNTSIILRTMQSQAPPSGTDSSLIFYSNIDRPALFSPDMKLGFWDGQKLVTGTLVHEIGKWYWVKIRLKPSGVSISSLEDNGYSLDTLPESGWAVAVNNNSSLKSTNATGNYFFGRNPNNSKSFCRGAIDAAGCAVYQDGTLIWKGVIDAPEPGSADYTTNERVAEKTSGYSGPYTSKTAVAETAGTADDYDRYEDVANTYAINSAPRENSATLFFAGYAGRQIDINGSTYTTAPDGSVVLTGEYGGKIVCRCAAGETLDATVEVIFDGRSYSVTLQRKYKVTISRYEKRYQVLTTICRGLAYQNEQVLYVQDGAEVTVTASGKWDHPGYIIVNGKNSKSSTLTITIKEDTTITTTEPYDDPSCSDSGCGGEGG